MHIHRSLVFAFSLVPVLLLASLDPTRADDDENALVTRIMSVGALTQGGSCFIPPSLTLVGPDTVCNEERPLFGAEGEEPVLPLGTLDEIAERIKKDVDPVTWQIVEGAAVRSMGERTLVVRAPARTVQAVARYLAELEQDVLATVSVDLRTVPLDRVVDFVGPRAVPIDEARVAQLLARADGGVRVAMHADHRVVAWVGAQEAYVGDWDVEVAQQSTISDPIVNVLNTGLVVSLLALPGELGAPIRLQVEATRVTGDASKTVTTTIQQKIQVPVVEGSVVRTEVVLEPGRWHVLQAETGAASGVAFLVRAVTAPARGGEADPGRTFRPGAADAGPLARRVFRVADLTSAGCNYVASQVFLTLSNFTPPEPPDLPESVPVVAQHGLADLLQILVSPRSWNRDGSGIDARYPRLYVTNTKRLLDETGRVLDALRSELLWTIVTDVVLLEGPASVDVAPPGGHEFDTEGLARLAALEADGTLVRRDAFRIASLAGGRRAAAGGREVVYLADYEVEIAQDATIQNPVMSCLRDGSTVDILPQLTTGRNGANVELRFLRTSVGKTMAETKTMHGPIQLPQLDVRQLKTAVHVAFGKTALAGAFLQGGRASWLLVTPRLEVR